MSIYNQNMASSLEEGWAQFEGDTSLQKIDYGTGLMFHMANCLKMTTVLVEQQHPMAFARQFSYAVRSLIASVHPYQDPRFKSDFKTIDEWFHDERQSMKNGTSEYPDDASLLVEATNRRYEAVMDLASRRGMLLKESIDETIPSWEEEQEIRKRELEERKNATGATGNAQGPSGNPENPNAV